MITLPCGALRLRLMRPAQKAKDGSVTIFIQKESPGKDKEGNWLPARNAPFFAVLRVYGPGESEQTGQWKAPAVERIK